MAAVDRSLVWTGTLNERALGGARMPTPGFYDTTLRDGEQSVGVMFDPEQKLEIAKLLDGIGVARIEAGFPRVSNDDRIAIAQIMKAGLSAQIWGFARALEEDVAAVADLGMRACVVEAPVSDLKLGALGISRDEVLGRVRHAVAFGARQGLQVAFFGVDATRADLAFLEQIYKTARDAGAQEFVMVDTIAIATPEAVTFLMGRAFEWLGADAVIHFHGHNDFGLATACAVAAAKAGAAWIHGTLDGIGERAGNANLPEIGLALELLYGAPTGLRFDRVRAASQRLREIAGYHLEPWKSVVGENLFVRETGAVAAQFHTPQAIEPYSSELLATRRGVVLGKKSGVASIKIKCEELKLDAPAASFPRLLDEVKSVAMRNRRLLTDDEFIQLVRRVAA